MNEFEKIMQAALDAAGQVPCNVREYVYGLENMLDMLKDQLAAARESARGAEE